MAPETTPERRDPNVARIAQTICRAIVGVACALMLLIALAASSHAQAQASKPKGGAHVYLLRGLANIFSLGMDDLGNQLAQRGISASVHNHLAWSSLADEAAQNYKSGRVRTIIIMGHSLGASAVVSMVERLGQAGVPVALAVTLDTPATTVSSGRAHRFINLYISTSMGGPFRKGPKFSGTLSNIDLSKQAEIGHFNIDKQPVIHKMLIGYVNQAIGRGGRPAPAKRAAPSDSAGAPAATTAATSSARARDAARN